MTVSEAAERLGISYNRTYKLVKMGRIRVKQKVGRFMLLCPESVRSFRRLPPGRKPKPEGV